MTSRRRLSDGLRNQADYGNPRRAEPLPLHAREERQLDAWEDDGGMVATPPKRVATLDLPELLQMPLK
jgi:hypothetical protein